MKFNLPEDIAEIINILINKGYEAYVVGGCVRDLLLNRKPSDYDITTNAKPDEILKIFNKYKTIEIGKEFGTIMVVYKGRIVEITTYRVESDYIDGRRPERVIYSSNLKEDLSRRDFTINALAYNDEEGLIDYFNGIEDLNSKVIRTVGNPKDRFSEDYLRILRAVRFSSQLDFQLDDKTQKACIEYSPGLKKISWERIRDEFYKIILSDNPSKGIELLNEVKLLGIILPELKECIGFDQKNPFHDKDVYKHSLCVLDNIKKDLDIRLAGLFHDLGKVDTFSIDENGIGHFFEHEKYSTRITEDILRRFNAPRKQIDRVCILVRHHMGHSGRLSDKGIRRLIYRVGEENIYDLLELQRADMKCSLGEQDLSMLDIREDDIDRILSEEAVYEKNKLDISGYDIINLGYSEGKIIGEILDYLMEKVLDNPELNKKELLEIMILNKYK